MSHLDNLIRAIKLWTQLLIPKGDLPEKLSEVLYNGLTRLTLRWLKSHIDYMYDLSAYKASANLYKLIL